ncbi:MAG: GMC oxidoreductase, partial [Pirellulales bacterium]|nr:GMC oxidoreductase [Pirellulales bacterium]
AEVGAQLQDHLIMPIIFRLRDRDRFPLVPTVRDIARWQMLGGGPIASNLAECGGLFGDGKFQIHVTPTHYLTHPQPDSAAAMTIGINLTCPDSRGRLWIQSADPYQPPLIEPNYLSASSDRRAMIDGVGLCRKIADREPLAGWIGEELLPGSKRQQPASIAKSLARYAQTLYHPVSTCRMGPDDEAVVDPEFQVRGTRGLWVCDASILPQLTVGNPNATVMTVAHHFAQTFPPSEHFPL